MDYSLLCHVHILRPTSSEEFYLMTTGTGPSTAVVVTNHFLTNTFKAFKADITDEVIQDWNLDPINTDLSPHLFLDEISKAMIGQDGFTFEIMYKYKVPQKLALVNIMDVKNPKTILEVDLKQIQLSEGFVAFSQAGLNTHKSSKQSEETKAEIKSLQKENLRLKKTLEDLIVAKAQWEDQHLRAFKQILNGKKQRICELQGIPSTHKKLRKRTQIQSSESELNTSDENGGNSEDYDRDTDVDDLDMEIVSVARSRGRSSTKVVLKAEDKPSSDLDGNRSSSSLQRRKAKEAKVEPSDKNDEKNPGKATKLDTRKRVQVFKKSLMDSSSESENESSKFEAFAKTSTSKQQVEIRPKSPATSETGDEFDF